MDATCLPSLPTGSLLLFSVAAASFFVAFAALALRARLAKAGLFHSALVVFPAFSLGIFLFLAAGFADGLGSVLSLTACCYLKVLGLSILAYAWTVESVVVVRFFFELARIDRVRREYGIPES